MITPTKGISPDRSLLAVGAQISMILNHPMTVSQAWSEFRSRREELGHRSPVSFEWFVLGLDVLYSLGALELRDGLLIRRKSHAAPSQR
ncbi:ABC-three component system middle component 6 [Streptomyces kebangsaanensis]|uniref:ABC-three component system middle component 6 n=1 Tax=Streptomyces kebangsaanensis TaxID=864058 RepID=UPI0009388C5E|nr:ABC-three component system middle component 6 [Streptomyces kebangsaanensis]